MFISESKLTEHMCNRSTCPAKHMVKVLVKKQDFQFCMHHYNEAEPMLVDLGAEIIYVESIEDWTPALKLVESMPADGDAVGAK